MTAKPVYELDILQKEKDENLPYWLNPSERRDQDSDSAKAIREKHRDRHLKEQKQKRWDRIIERAEALGMRVVDPPTEEAIKEALRFIGKEWDESKHPRVPGGSSEGGEFGEGGGGSEADDQGGSGAGSTSQPLTKLDKKRVENWLGSGYKSMRYDKTFATTLNKLPKFSGKVFRGARISKDDLKKLKKGAVYPIEKFSSASMRRGVAESFMNDARDKPDKPIRVIFEIQDRGAKIPKDIAKENGVEDEAEVVLMMGDKYKIDKVRKEFDDVGKVYTIVQMSEAHAK